MNQLKTREQAAEMRDTGMMLAEDKAERVAPGWADDAATAIHLYIWDHPGRQFLGEDVREWAETKGLIQPADNARAWGAVFQRAARAGLICKAGYALARSSNLSPKVLWQAAA